MTDWRAPAHDAVNCRMCRPTVFDPSTGKVEPKLTMMAEEVWRASGPEEKRAWHRVTCLNSRAPVDMMLAQGIARRLQEKLEMVRPPGTPVQ